VSWHVEVPASPDTLNLSHMPRRKTPTIVWADRNAASAMSWHVSQCNIVSGRLASLPYNLGQMRGVRG